MLYPLFFGSIPLSSALGMESYAVRVIDALWTVDHPSIWLI